MSTETPEWQARFLEGMSRDVHGLFTEQAGRAIFKHKDGDGLKRIAEAHNKQVSELTARIAELEKVEADVAGIKLWSGDVRAMLGLKIGDSVIMAIQALQEQLAEARKDSARIDAIIANKWTVTWNYLRDSFIIQSQNQICGNIGHSKPLRELLDAATPLPETKGQLVARKPA